MLAVVLAVVLQDEAAASSAEPSADALQPNDSCSLVRAVEHQVTKDSVAFEVAAERLGDIRVRQLEGILALGERLFVPALHGERTACLCAHTHEIAGLDLALIVKTRRVMKVRSDTPKGLLDRKHSQTRFELTRFEPESEDVAVFVSHYWVVSWDLVEPYFSESLPYPNVHVVFQRGASGVFGVVRRKFVRCIEGRDRAFGASFRPGGFYPVAQLPISQFTDRRALLDEVFGADGLMLEEAMLATHDQAAQIARFESFVRDRRPVMDEAASLVGRVVDRIANDRTLVKVEGVARAAGLSRRQLERLFGRYVGVSPKWVIQRYRLFEAAEALVSRPEVDAAALAAELGYADQAHFIKDFKSMVGSSPAAYARRAS